MIEEGIPELWKTVSYYFLIIFFILAVVVAFLTVTKQSEESITLRKAGVSLTHAISKWESSPGCISTSKVSSSDLPGNSRASIYRADGTLVSQVTSGHVTDPVVVKVPIVVDGEEGYIVFEVSRS